MEHPINKDVLVQILLKENEGLKEVNQLQQQQLKSYEKMQAVMEQKEHVNEQLSKAYTDAIVSLEKRLRTLHEQNEELTRRLEELQSPTDVVAGEAK